jgi:hypothetical protein
MGKKRTAYRLLAGMPERKVLLGRPRRRRVVTIKMNLGKIDSGSTDCIDLDQDRDLLRALVSTAMNYRFPKILESS